MATEIGPVTGDSKIILDIIKAAKSGASVEELSTMIASNYEILLAQPEATQRLIVEDLADTNFNDALTQAAMETGNLKTGTAPILGLGGAQIGPIGTFTDEAGNVLKEYASKPGFLNALKNWFIGSQGHRGAALGRTVGTGAVGFGLVSGIQGGEGFGSQQPGGQGPSASPGAQGPQGQQVQSFASQNPEVVSSFTRANTPTVPKQFTTGGLTHPDPKSGFNIMVVDRDGSMTGTPGAIAVVNSTEAGLTPDLGVQALINEQLVGTGGTDAFSALTSNLQQVNAQGVATQEREVFQMLFPQSVGVIGFDRPVSVRPSTGRAPDISRVGVAPPTDPRLKKEGIEESQNAASTAPALDDINVPAGAQIAPRTFDTYNGRTLLEWASIAANKHGVPLNLLYGIIDHESNWLTSAVGDNGNSFGLAQIYMPTWGSQVSQSQALNPVFALNWTAQKLAQRFQQYGRWDAAVAAHNSPVAAQHLVSTGKFQNEKSANYVGDVFKRADRSALADYLFGGDTADIPVGGSTGVQYTPFQAPDPAESREYIRSVYDRLLGRGPTDEELAAGVEEILSLSRSAYSANLTQAKGGESEGVDIEARFEDTLKGTGEFEFHEETVEQRSFTDFAASIASLMQRGI